MYQQTRNILICSCKLRTNAYQKAHNFQWEIFREQRWTVESEHNEDNKNNSSRLWHMYIFSDWQTKATTAPGDKLYTHQWLHCLTHSVHIGEHDHHV